MNDEKILNKGLDLAMEFGPNWLQPIQSRLSKEFPQLEWEALNHYDKICRAAMKSGNDYVYKTLASATSEHRKIKQQDLVTKLRDFLHKDYPWIDDSTMNALFSQGCYYAWKDGLHLAMEE